MIVAGAGSDNVPACGGTGKGAPSPGPASRITCANGTGFDAGQTRTTSMRKALPATALLFSSLLAACSAGYGADVRGDDDHIPVCQEQNELAKNGRTDGREISITCPEHGITD